MRRNLGVEEDGDEAVAQPRLDPDGVHLEVNLFKDAWTEREMLKREDWTVVELASG